MDVDRYAPRRGRMLFLRALRSIFNDVRAAAHPAAAGRSFMEEDEP